MPDDRQAIEISMKARSDAEIAVARLNAHEDMCIRASQENVRAIGAVWTAVTESRNRLESGFNEIKKNVDDKIGDMAKAMAAENRSSRDAERNIYITAIVLLLGAVATLVFYMLTSGHHGT